MEWKEAQREARSAFVGGSVGQIVSGIIWLLAAALGTWAGRSQGIITLFFGGMLIFPLTQLSLRLIGKRGALSRENPLNKGFMLSVLAMVASYPLVYMATVHSANWFFPAFALVIAAHYLWFVLLYGMWHYAVLAAVLANFGAGLAMAPYNTFTLCGWLGGTAILLFGIIIGVMYAIQKKRAAVS